MLIKTHYEESTYHIMVILKIGEIRFFKFFYKNKVEKEKGLKKIILFLLEETTETLDITNNKLET